MNKVSLLVAASNLHCVIWKMTTLIFSLNIEDYEEESVDLESENETAALQGATAIPINKCFLCYCLHIKDCLFFLLKCKEPAFIINSSAKGRSLIITLHLVKDTVKTWVLQLTINHV